MRGYELLMADTAILVDSIAFRYDTSSAAVHPS